MINMVEEKQEISKALTYLYSIQLSVIFGMQAESVFIFLASYVFV